MALANATQIVDFADALTRSADSIHDRLLTAIRNNEVDHPTAQMIFQDESILRQRANGLYIDAASCVVAGLDEAQKSVIDLVDTANARMRKIKEMAQLIDLVADLLLLATATYAAKPRPIIAALKEVRRDVEALTGKA
jgi:hypothetical protein